MSLEKVNLAFEVELFSAKVRYDASLFNKFMLYGDILSLIFGEGIVGLDSSYYLGDIERLLPFRELCINNIFILLSN